MKNTTEKSKLWLVISVVLGFLVVPYSRIIPILTLLFGRFFFLGFTVAGLVFYGLWWALGMLCATKTQRPLLALLCLNGAATLHFILVLFGIGDSGALFSWTLALISLPMVMFPQLNSTLIYLLGLALAYVFSFLGCATAKKKS